MAEQKETTAVIHQVPKQPADNSITVRVPKPNLQVAVLGLVAFITLFQTFQLIRINSSSTTTTVKAAPVSATSDGGGSGGDASTPQSMVGGC